jgi:hypothetical protein
MANASKVALAVGAGYLLGRTKRTRLALMLAAAGITGKFPSSPTDLVAHGVKSLGTSSQLTELTDQLRGELLNAAKAAAVAAATSRVDALNDRLQGVVPPLERIGPGGSGGGGVGCRGSGGGVGRSGSGGRSPSVTWATPTGAGRGRRRHL